MAEAFTFALLGGIIFLGFLASKFFQKTKVSEVLILMLVGFLLGPMLKIVDSGQLISFVPLFSGLALVILLFGSGINLNFHKVLYELAPASLFTFLAFIASTIAIGATAHLLIGWPLLVGIMFGAVVSGTSSEVVFTLMRSVKAREEIKTMLELESVLTDALTIVVALTIAQLISTNSIDLANATNAIAGGFSIAAVVGLVAGAVWVNLLKGFKGQFDYMLTIAAALMLYAGVEFTGGNGGIAVLVFGIILGNAKQLIQMVTQKKNGEIELPQQFKNFQNEISFFTRTFFFVYFGLILSIEALTLNLLLATIAIVAVALIARWLVTKALGYANKPEGILITTMIPHGLAAAVMASVAATHGINAPGFTETAMLVIIASNIVSTIGVFKSERDNALRKPSIVKMR